MARGAHLVKRRTLLLGLQHQTQIRRLSGRKANSALRRAARVFAYAPCLSPLDVRSPVAVRVTVLRARAHFALPMRAAARARRALHFDPPVIQCTARRAARACITVGVLRRLPARWIGECRRRTPTAHPSAPAALGEGRGAAVRRRAEVHLALPCLVVREPPAPFRESLRRVPARARPLRFSVSAVRRSAAVPVFVLDGPVGAAQQQLRDACRTATVRGIVQRRVPARPTAAGARPAHSTADSPRAQTAHP